MELNFPITADGATGTQLQKRGYTGAECAEKWVQEHPETITELQQLYAEAGSNIVYAPTFGANSVKLEESRLFNCVGSYNAALVGISRAAVGGRAFVAGDISPTGKFLMPLGDMSFDELYEVYREQAEALEKAGADLFAVETMMTVSDARAAVLAIRSVSNKPVFVTVTCGDNGKMLTGTDPAAALVILQGMGVDAFGLNCSTGPDKMLERLKILRDYAVVPLIAKPNAGMPEQENGKTVYRCTPEEFGSFVPQFAAAGVGVFGGCCGTGPEHIKAITEALKDIKFNPPAPKYADKIVCATEKDVFVLEPDVSTGTVLACDGSLSDNIEDENEKPGIMAIAINEPGDLDIFARSQYAVRKPLCIVCNDAGLLEEALRLYQGRALYEGNIPASQLEALEKKYGLIY